MASDSHMAFLDEAQRILAGLEFPACEGAFCEGETGYLEIIPVPLPQAGRYDLKVTLRPYGLDADVPADAQAAAREAFRAGLASDRPAVREAAEHGLRELALPRIGPDELAAMRVILRRRRDGATTTMLPAAWTDAAGCAYFTDVDGQAVLRAEVLPPPPPGDMDSGAAQDRKELVGTEWRGQGAEPASQAQAQPPATGGSIVCELPDGRVSAILEPAGPGVTAVTVQTSAAELAGAAVVFQLPGAQVALVLVRTGDRGPWSARGELPVDFDSAAGQITRVAIIPPGQPGQTHGPR